MLDSDIAYGHTPAMLTRKQLAALKAAKLTGPNKLKKAIELAETTQEQVAAALGLSQPHISEIANGNYSRLPMETTRALADHFGCSIEDLFPAKQAVAS